MLAERSRSLLPPNGSIGELQALIRARSSAGSSALFARFASAVRKQVFRPDVSVKEALASVRLAKQKIDKHIERSAGGFNVKLNRGGIREIEFVAQALQLAHGGNDEWLRVAHTLISLGRLADRSLITEQERTELSDAYDSCAPWSIASRWSTDYRRTLFLQLQNSELW